ncbi:GntR family transcriptional regulator [Fervidicella metallireducens AeB]|uniref:GntR family transcriptional regulator n=1 Tax=Fervidicella metallireducens AeB TaxID=1403537 RepID=A0A017RTT2_9CLOT|nr:GntR family transcriptional regulator [Fervidicella metallireducens]EYE87315.1 GntR family transcriptional regulator [Fervidicella metallireducens AeB]
MIMKLDMSSTTPIYVQLRNQIVLGIGKGEIKIGQSLPTVRQLAEDIGVNTMTVSKAYSILKNEGYIEIDRRHGAKVNPSLDISGEFKERLEEELSLLIAEFGIKGVNKREFMDICSRIFDSMNIPSMVGGGV